MQSSPISEPPAGRARLRGRRFGDGVPNLIPVDMAKRKTTAEKIAGMSVPARVELAKKLTDRVTDHLLYLLKLHETNRIVTYSPTLSSQIPLSHAANAFLTFQRGLHQMEIVRLCALWDSAELEKENIPTVIELIDHADVIDILANETASHWKERPSGPIFDLSDDPELRALTIEAYRRIEHDFGDQQSSDFLNSVLAGNLSGDGCDQHWVASQPFVRSATPPKRPKNWPEIPAFRHLASSPDAMFAELQGKIVESLRPCPRIFPFCGDYRRRLV